mgnify:FL=1
MMKGLFVMTKEDKKDFAKLQKEKVREPKFTQSVLWEYMTKAERVSRPYTSSDFVKEYFIPNL